MYELWCRAVFSFISKVIGKSAMETAAADGMAYCAIRLNTRGIKAILDCTGVDVNTKPPSGFTALQWAVFHNSPETVRFLLRAGARPTVDVLEILIYKNYQERNRGRHVLGLLLAAGVSLEEGESLGHLLSYELERGNYITAPLLLAAGAPWEVHLQHHFRDALIVCAMVNHREIAAKELELVGFGEIRDRLLEICVGLHDADLPTPILTLIVEFACEPFASRLPYHYLWDSVVTIRHYRTRRHTPAPQYGDLIVTCRRKQDRFFAREIEALEEKDDRANEMYNRKDFAGALPLFQELLALQRTVLGERCIWTLVSKFNLALTLAGTGCLEEAKALYLDMLQPDVTDAWHGNETRVSILTRARIRLDTQRMLEIAGCAPMTSQVRRVTRSALAFDD